MPGLFGASGRCDSGERLRHEVRRIWKTDLEERDLPAGWLSGHAHPPHRALVHTGATTVAGDGEFGLYRALSRHPTVPAFTLSPAAGVSMAPSARGNLAIADTRSGELVLVVDWLSAFPLYVAMAGPTVLFSSHLKPLADAVRAPVDPAGLLQYVCQNWCLNGRTPFAGVRRLLPGQLMRVAPGLDPVVTDTSELWSDGLLEGPRPSDDEVWSALVEAARDSTAPDESMALMLSGGWDSRVLLGALLDGLGNGAVVTASHGQLDNLELRLARRLASGAAVRHLETQLDQQSLGSSADLDCLFERTEALLFPYWRLSGRKVQLAGAVAAASGVLGEALGGHYTVSGPLGVRFRQFVRQKLFRRGDAGTPGGPAALRETIARTSRLRPMFYLRHEFIEDHRRDIERATADDAEAVVARYRRRGISGGGALVEAYITEHRGLMMIAKQPLAARQYVDVSLPFADKRLMAAVCRVPVPDRIHNTLSRRLLERSSPGLLRFPLAATLVAARRPILLQEVGRIVRHTSDELTDRLFLSSRGRLGRSRPMGWMNFEQVLREGRVLDDLVDALRNELFDKVAIRQRLADIRNYRSHIKLAHPFLQMADVDRLLSPREEGPR